MKIPYLVQRAKIRNPLVVGTERLSHAVNFDYMGSSEFEYGALAKSFRAMEGKELTLRVFDAIAENGIPLRVLSLFQDDRFHEYGQYLLRLRNQQNGKIHLKENSGFDPDFFYNKNTNFWWDIENHVMWSFHKPFMNRLTQHIHSSLKYMNEQAAA